jgi:shikimate dehydrogenase
MPLLGLIGYPLSHSFSPQFFKGKFESLGLTDWDYQLFPLPDITALPSLLDNHELIALNVTIPHKQSVLRFCTELSPEVKAIGAANLIIISRPDQHKAILKAHNTDYYGFSESLRHWYGAEEGKALILGTGGSSKAVQYALSIMNIHYDVVGRHSTLNYQNIELGDYKLIINCTPVGMKYSESETLPLPYEQVHEGQFFYDLVYNPSETAMMKLFADKGVIVKNGLEMLHLQAERTWEIVNMLD